MKSRLFMSGSTRIIDLFTKWRGSIWKMTYKEMIVFLIAYYAVNLCCRFYMTETDKQLFESYVNHFSNFRRNHIPISFILGFYVTVMVNRRWRQFELLPCPDYVLSKVTFNIPGDDERSCLMRQLAARYFNLSLILAYRDISSRVRKRFPTYEHLMKAHLATEVEIALIRDLEKECPENDELSWILPIEWAQRIVEQVYSEGKIAPPLAATLLGEMNDYKQHFMHLYQYVWATLPLVYTHVAALAVYTNFLLTIISAQFIPKSKTAETGGTDVDYYVPVLTLIELMFYIGWFKVGCELMDPFGEDDSDFDLNFMVDRHWFAGNYLSNRARLFNPMAQYQCSGQGDHVNQTVPSFVLVSRLPHTILSAKLQHDSIKLPAKHIFDTLRVDPTTTDLLQFQQDTTASLQRKVNETPKSVAIRRQTSEITLSSQQRITNYKLRTCSEDHFGRHSSSLADILTKRRSHVKRMHTSTTQLNTRFGENNTAEDHSNTNSDAVTFSLDLESAQRECNNKTERTNLRCLLFQ